MSIDAEEHNQFLNNIPDFYKNVLTSWVKTGGGQLISPLTFSTIRKQILWENRFITFENMFFYFLKKVLIWRQWLYIVKVIGNI